MTSRQQLETGAMCVLGFAIPVSTALSNISLGIVLLLLLSRLGKAELRILSKHPVALAALALFTLLLVGTSYSSVPVAEALKTLNKYRELLYIPLFIVLFQTANARRYGLYGLAAGVVLTLLLSYISGLSGFTIGKSEPGNAVIFKNHITQGFLLALAAYAFMVYAVQKRRWSFALIATLAAFNMVVLTQGRTGYLVLMSLCLLLAFQVQRWRGFLLGGIIVAGLGGVAYVGADGVHTRIDDLLSNIQNHQPGAENPVGYRLDWYRNTLDLIAEHPWLGTGTGSFANEYGRLAEARGLSTTPNPHNEYLLLAVQVGASGIILFLLLFYTLWRYSHWLPPNRAWLAQGLVVAMVSGCLANSLLLDSTEGHLFAFVTGLLFAKPNSSPC